VNAPEPSMASRLWPRSFRLAHAISAPMPPLLGPRGSWIVVEEVLEILGSIADAILPIETVLSCRRCWIFAFAAVGIPGAIVAAQSASGGEASKASVCSVSWRWPAAAPAL
jgi:hypothetical protein